MSEIEVAIVCEAPEATILRLPEISAAVRWSAGDPTVRSGLVRHKSAGWAVRSSMPPSTSLEEHVKGLRQLLDPFADILRDVGAAWGVELSVTVYLDDEAPVMQLSSENTRWLAAIGGSVDVDIYLWLPDRAGIAKA